MKGWCVKMNKAFELILARLEEVENRLLNKSGDIGCIIGITNMSEYSKQIVHEVAEEYKDGWIPVKTRPMTEEEKEYYSEFLFEGNGIIYECTLPDDGQEVLITSKFGSVDKTTFYTDCGNYFENYEDYDEVLAWQPLPLPYKEE